MESKKTNLILIGFMGSGKSTVASCFGKKYAMDIVEMDEAIAEKEGRSIPQPCGSDGYGDHGRKDR